ALGHALYAYEDQEQRNEQYKEQDDYPPEVQVVISHEICLLSCNPKPKRGCGLYYDMESCLTLLQRNQKLCMRLPALLWANRLSPRLRLVLWIGILRAGRFSRSTVCCLQEPLNIRRDIPKL